MRGAGSVTLVTALGLLTGCAAARPPTERPAEVAPGVRLFALERGAQGPRTGVRLEKLAPAAGVEAGMAVQRGQALGTVQPEPERLSARHHDAIVTARRLAGERRLREALEVIEPVYRDEPENRFARELYAYTLFWLDRRAESFPVYRSLVDDIDRDHAGEPGVVVDQWHVDAYFKVGVLHLDRREWWPAAYEISRALASGRSAEPAFFDLALGYLAEAFYEMGDFEVARYYADHALRLNPRNEYVRRYLKERDEK